MSEILSSNLKEVLDDLRVGVLKSSEGAPVFEAIREAALERSKLNTPIATGALRESESVILTVRKGSVTWDFHVNVPYGLKVHEEPYHLGAISKAQPGTPEGGVGNKFFSRVIDFWQEKWADRIVTGLFD